MSRAECRWNCPDTLNLSRLFITIFIVFVPIAGFHSKRFLLSVSFLPFSKRCVRWNRSPDASEWKGQINKRNIEMVSVTWSKGDRWENDNRFCIKCNVHCKHFIIFTFDRIFFSVTRILMRLLIYFYFIL